MPSTWPSQNDIWKTPEWALPKMTAVFVPRVSWSGGWMVLRFCYEDVMLHPEEVSRILLSAVDLAELLSEVGRRPKRAA